MSVDEARHHVGLLEVETVPQTVNGKTTYKRQLKGGENQGVVMLCNKQNVEQLLGVTQSGAMKYEGLISVLIGQTKKVTVGAINGRGGTDVLAESAYAPYAGLFSRLLITVDEAGTLFGSKDKLGAEHKKNLALVNSDMVGEKLMDMQQDVAEHLGGVELRRFNVLATNRELFKRQLNEDDDEEGLEDDERTLRRHERAAGAARPRDDDELSSSSLFSLGGGNGDDDDDNDDSSVVVDEEQQRAEQELLKEQAEALESILERVNCAGSAVFGLFMVDATPFRVVLERDHNPLATTSTRVMQPEPNAAYIGFRVPGSPQENNPFHIVLKSVPQPSTTRVVGEHMMRLLYLVQMGYAQRTVHGDGSVEYEVLARFAKALKFEPSRPGDVASGEPATQLSVHIGPRPRLKLTDQQKQWLKKNKKDQRLPPVEQWYQEPANWDDGDMGMTFEEFVSAVHHPDLGMHAYVEAAQRFNKMQPQENEYQRLAPALDSVLADWGSPGRARATGLHLLWATTDARTSNYELFYLQRNLLSQKPLNTVQHVQAVLFNGGGTTLQIVLPRARYDAGESPTPMDFFEILQRPEFGLLWQKRIRCALSACPSQPQSRVPQRAHSW